MSRQARKTGRVPSRRPKTTILIVGEGRKTEPSYFRGLYEEVLIRQNYKLTIKKGNGGTREQIVREAINHQAIAHSREEDYDQVWCVLDVEDAAKRPSAMSAAGTAQDQGIILCWSNPCFEIWLLSHFGRHCRPHTSPAEVEAELAKIWKANFRQPYEKKDDRIYERLSDRTREAIDNAKWVRETHHKEISNTVDANSSTDAYKLVSLLIDGPV